MFAVILLAELNYSVLTVMNDADVSTGTTQHAKYTWLEFYGWRPYIRLSHGFPFAIRWTCTRLPAHRPLTLFVIPSLLTALCLAFRSVNSFVQHKALYIETLRECYEAYVVYNFLYFLVCCLGNVSIFTVALNEGAAADAPC